MNFFTWMIVLLVITVCTFLGFLIGWSVSGAKTVKLLREKGWKIEPPEVDAHVK